MESLTYESPPQLRVQDVDGLWSGTRVPMPIPPGGSGSAAECLCRIPWWIWRVSLRVEAAVGENWAAPHCADVAMGENQIWMAGAGTGATGVAGDEGADCGAGDRRWQLVKVVRDEPLMQLFPQLRRYEASQASLLIFIVGLLASLQFGAPSLLAAPLLAAIPVHRMHPELICLLNPWRRRVCRNARGAAATAGGALLVVWLLFVCLSAAYATKPAREAWPPRPLAPAPAPPPPRLPLARDCSSLGGVDCSEDLAEWAEPGNCAILAQTNGTCNNFCRGQNRLCQKAVDDDGSGLCRINEGGKSRQTNQSNGCEQDWRIQVCACSGSSTRDQEPGQRPPSPAPVVRPEEERLASEILHTDWEGDQEELARACLQWDVVFVPISKRTVEQSAARCQTTCANMRGCAHFSWWPENGNCHLSEPRAVRRHAIGGLSGPPRCGEEPPEPLPVSTSPPSSPLHHPHSPALPPDRRHSRLSTTTSQPRSSASATVMRQRLQMPSEGSLLTVTLVCAVFVGIAASAVLDSPVR